MKQHFENNADLDESFKIGTRLYEFNVLEELSFDFETINEDFKDHAKQTALIQSMYETAKTTHSKLKLKLKKDKAVLWARTKEEVTDSNGKALSDKRVDLAVDADEATYKQELELIDAEGVVIRLEGILENFSDRKSLIQSFNTNLRKTI